MADDLEQQRDALLERVKREDAELRQAVADLKEAVSKPFRLIERIRENPVPWLLSGALVGMWLASGNGSDEQA